MDIDRHEVWAQGSRKGDPPIEVNEVPHNVVGIRKQRNLKRLQDYKKGDISDQKTDELFSALLDVLGVQDTPEEQEHNPFMEGLRGSINRILRRRGNDSNSNPRSR